MVELEHGKDHAPNEIRIPLPPWEPPQRAVTPYPSQQSVLTTSFQSNKMGGSSAHSPITKPEGVVLWSQKGSTALKRRCFW